MSLVQSITGLAARVGEEVRSRVSETHPGLIRAWGGYSGGVLWPNAYNVSGIDEMSLGLYRMSFRLPMQDAHYVVLVSSNRAFKVVHQDANGFEVRFRLFGFWPCAPGQFTFGVLQ